MKKTILLLALGLGISTAAQAQYRGRGGNVSLGIKAGASLTDFVGVNAHDGFGNTYENRFGFHAGVFANIGFAKLFAFQPELLYSQKGAKTQNVDERFRLHYVDVPLVFHFNTDGFFLEAGPQVGILLAAKRQVGNTSVDIDNYKTVDFGYVAGLGYQLKHGLGAGLRYNGAFTNFPQSTTSGNVTTQNRIRNSAFQLYATYSFN
jgi:hypothetical protein